MRSQAWLPCLLCSGLLLGGAASPDQPAARLQAPGWSGRHQDKLTEIRRGPVDLIFLGDSITEELEKNKPEWGDLTGVWRRHYGCHHAVNLGFSGDTTSNVLWRIENGEVDGIRPRLAILMIGTNNIRPRIESSAEGTTQGIIAVVTELHRRLPTSMILLLGIPPSGRAKAVEDERAKINANLASHSWAGLNTTFLNIDSALENGGQVDPSLYRGAPGKPVVHLNADGWQRLADLIEPTVERLSGLPGCAP
jgi:lysophospholipase L1-like esterase